VAELRMFRALAGSCQKAARAEWFTPDRHQGRFPLLELCRKTQRKYEQMNEDGVLYGDQSFVSQLRVRKRLNTEVHGYEYAQQFDGGDRLTGSNTVAFKPLPSCHVSTLDLTALRDTEAPMAVSNFVGDEFWDDAEIL